MPAMSLKDMDGASTETMSYSAPDAVQKDSHNGVTETGTSPQISKSKHDSGYGELSHQKDITASSPPNRQPSTDNRPLQAQTQSGSPRRAHTRSNYSHTSTSSSSAARTPHSRTTSQSTIRSTSRRTTSRPSSTIHAPHSSPSSSRHSSKLSTHTPPASNSPRPLLHTRSSSTAYARPRPEDPFSIHQRSCTLFRSLTATPTTNSSNPSFDSEPQPPTTALPTYLPATTIDWTHPSTRLSEYEKIDRSCRGIRGVWRRLAPRWCTRGSRMGFYRVEGEEGGDDGKSDAGSVRRYRVSPGGEKISGESEGEEGEQGGGRQGVKGWGWFCRRGK